MKGKGKWAALAFALGLLLAGCGGGGGGGASSDEGAIAPNESGVLLTLLVNVDPTGKQLIFEPLSLDVGATPKQGLGANTALTELYSWTNQLVVTDLTILASTTVIGFNLDGTDTTTWKDVLKGTTGLNKKMVVGSEVVYRCNPAIANPGNRCRNLGPAWAFGTGGSVYVRGSDYAMNYFTRNNDTVVGRSARIKRLAGSKIPATAGTTVRIKFGYGNASEAGYTAGVFTTKIAVENHLNATLEKLRSWTGNCSGTGCEDNPQLGVGGTATGRSDYPLLGGDTSSNYAKPSTTPQPIAGWVGGICYSAWGKWTQTDKANEGCPILKHPRSDAAMAWNYMDPVCGRFTDTVKYAGTASKYKFYMQLGGNVYPWSSGAKPADSRWDNTNYSTMVSQMAYLVADSSSTEFCSAASTARYWWLGSMAPIKYGRNKHCGTLITDPHLAPRTYFALNLGIEYSDTIEKGAKAFWDVYDGNSGGTQTISGPVAWEAGFGIVYDANVLKTFASNSNTGHSGSTLFPGGFAPQNETGTYGENISVIPKNHPAGGKWFNAVFPGSNYGLGYIMNVQAPAPGKTAFSFFPGPITTTTTTPTSSKTVKHYSAAPAYSQTAPYITQAFKCKPANGIPKWAGQWGLVHYNSTCNMITDGVDADVDFWYGMQVFQVFSTAKAGDWSTVKYDLGSDNYMKYRDNEAIATHHNFSYCLDKNLGQITCTGSDPTAITQTVWQSQELTNPLLPPGQQMAVNAWGFGCPYGSDGRYTCGGIQYMQSVVCVK